MPGTAKGKVVKIRLKYDKGSQTLSQCDPLAEDRALYEAAKAIADLRKDENIEIVKITEADLVG